jgi:hypothetical protein
MQTSLGTVKSRLVRGREALRKRLQRHLAAFGKETDEHRRRSASIGGRNVEVIP